MLIYLDLCCFNRPYDDQTQPRIRFETAAKLILQQKVRDGECRLLWSATLDFECSNNPYEEHRLAIEKWRHMAERVVLATDVVIDQAKQLAKQGIGNYDALHVASAIDGGAELFVTTDDRLLKKLQGNDSLRAMLPGEALAYLEDWYEN